MLLTDYIDTASKAFRQVQIKTASRLALLPPYFFAELDRLKKEVQSKGVDVISLGIGDPDLPTPRHIVDSLKRNADDPKNHRYPDYEGLPQFRQTAADWYQAPLRRRVSIRQREVCALIGSKEGIANFSTAVVDPGDIVLIPDPGYPVYYSGCVFNGGEPYFLTLKKENGFLPDLGSIPPEVARRAKCCGSTIPNNPTAATVELSFFQDAVKFCLKNDIILAHDSAYSEIAYDGYRSPSVFQAEGSRECAIEFHSLSKTFSMTGWRVGFAIGNAQLIGALGKVKTNLDSGVFQAVQEAAITGLEGGRRRQARRILRYLQRAARRAGRSSARARSRMRNSARNLLCLDQSSTWLHLGFIYRARVAGSRRRNHARLRVRQGW